LEIILLKYILINYQLKGNLQDLRPKNNIKQENCNRITQANNNSLENRQRLDRQLRALTEGHNATGCLCAESLAASGGQCSSTAAAGRRRGNHRRREKDSRREGMRILALVVPNADLARFLHDKNFPKFLLDKFIRFQFLFTYFY
jgi:hypothetical protein